jgi:hypothetical protein
MMVVIDSVSRRQFYRKLPSTVNFLNKINKNLNVVDFKLHNVNGEYSHNSFMPIFFGQYKYTRIVGTPGDPHY